MVYAMISIGILGFIVWSYLMGSSSCERWVLIFAICWNGFMLVNTLNSKNVTSYARSAGNGWQLSSLVLDHTNTSETTRGNSFNYDAFRAAGGNSSIPQDWLTWFVGFAEGDGAILTDLKKNQPRFVLTQKEGAILYTVRDMFGFGIVKYYAPNTSNNKNGFYRWLVHDRLNIRILTHLFNGHLVSSHRIVQLESWIKVLNKSTHHSPITHISTPVIISLYDSWLAGFTDAEGCFNVSIIKNTRYRLGYVIKLRFILDQKNQAVLDTVQALFKFGIVTKRNDAVKVFRYTVHGFTNMTTVRDYFANYPLLTKKSESLVQWSNIHDIILSKRHLTLEGLNEVRWRTKLMNTNNSQLVATGSSLVSRYKIEKKD